MEYQSIGYICVGLVVGILWSLDYWRIGQRSVINIPSRYQKNKWVTVRSLLFVVGLTGYILVSIGMGGPRKPLGKKEGIKKINDVMFVLDVSGSMRTIDFEPNRLEAAKKTISAFIKLRPRDRIGLIVFAEKAFTLLPLSTDNKLIIKTIKEVKIGYAGIGQGTNIGDAIGLAVARSALSEAKKKTIILLTDGVSMAGNLTPTQSAKEAAAAGIKIHVIGLINESKSALMPKTDKYGNVRYNRFGKRTLVKVPGGSVDKEAMTNVVKITGGTFHLAGDIKGLKNVFNQINKLERGEIKSSGEIEYEEIFWKYLFLGAILIIGVEILRRFILREGY